MELFTSWIGSVLALFYALWIVGANIVRIVIWVKCFKVKKCNNRKCLFRCCKYKEILNEEDYQRILQIITDLK